MNHHNYGPIAMSMIAMMSTAHLSITGIIIVFFLRGCTRAQGFQWQCSPLDPATNTHYFPDLPVNNRVIAGDAYANILMPSRSDTTYIYPVPSTQVNCNGTVMALDYCYSGGQIGRRENAFTFITLEQSGNSPNWRVIRRVSVQTTPLETICTSSDSQYCCDTMPLDVTDHFAFPSPAEINFAFGITIPDSDSDNTPQLLAVTNKIVQQYILSDSPDETVRLNTQNLQSDQGVRLLRFRINVGGGRGGGGGGGGGVAAGVAVPLVIIIVVCAVVAVVVVALVMYRKKSASKQLLDHGNSSTFNGAINRDNADHQEDQYTEMSCEYAGIGPEAYSEPHLSNPSYLYEEQLDEDIYMVPAKDETRLYTQLEEIRIKNLLRDDVILGCQLGSGQFGVVYKGTLRILNDEVEVAVKTLKEGSREEDRIKFLQEAAIMGQFKHPNVVTMHGVVTAGGPTYLVLELLMKGDLRMYLLHMKSSDEGDQGAMDSHTFLSYCRQVASGMAYLSNKAFVHRDLAARNILVSEDEICKIADFGMSRDLVDEDYYVAHGGKIPVKWTAPEALYYKKYSSASDVWSYGALMYEIWSVGHKPFESFGNAEVLKLIDAGHRLPPPPGCPRALYSIMISCWHKEASRRPDFVNIAKQLSLSDTALLKWSVEDRSVHPEATKLGANLLCGQELYKDLQTLYQK